MYIYMYVFFFRLFSIIGYYKTLSRVLCVTQSVLVIYFFYSYLFTNFKYFGNKKYFCSNELFVQYLKQI